MTDLAPHTCAAMRQVIGGEFRRRVGERVRQLREQRGWKSAELAKRWGQPPPVVSRLEGGGDDARVPRLDTLAGLADAFGMTLADFIWPVIEPDDAEATAERSRRRYRREMVAFQQKKRAECFAALESEQAQWFFESIADLVASNELEDVQVVAAMVKAAVEQLRFSRQPSPHPATAVDIAATLTADRDPESNE